MKTVSITTTQNVAIEYPLATLGDRILAELLDGVFRAAYVLVLYFLFLLMAFVLHNFEESSILIAVLIVIVFLPIILYHLIFEAFMNGQTFGMRIMKCRVASLDGNSVSFGRYFIRWLFRIIDIMPYGVVALLTIGLSDKRQRVGDMLANTIVMKTDTVTYMERAPIAPPSVEYEAKYPEAAYLKPKDIQLIREVLDNSTKTGNTMLDLELANKIEQLINVKRKEDPATFLHIILQDYRHLV